MERWGWPAVAMVVGIVACAGPAGLRHRIADRPTLPELPSGPHPFVWPLSTGAITSGFGPRGGTHHDGVDISCEPGAPVRASRAGRVLYSDTLRGYGNLIIVEHDDGYATVYAHNQANRAEIGVAVRQGDVIAACGESGETSGPHLHFEVRKDNIARNPLFYLPGLPAVAGGVHRGGAPSRSAPRR